MAQLTAAQPHSHEHIDLLFAALALEASSLFEQFRNVDIVGMDSRGDQSEASRDKRGFITTVNGTLDPPVGHIIALVECHPK